MIRANELMQGDWVNLSKGNWSENRQVELLDIEMIAESVYFAEPIPITPEILEKNFPRPDVVAWWPILDGFHCETRTNGDIMVSGNFRYIHQLQHALSLCQIDKTIEL